MAIITFIFSKLCIKITVISQNKKDTDRCPFCFGERGICPLSGVLRSKKSRAWSATARGARGRERDKGEKKSIGSALRERARGDYIFEWVFQISFLPNKNRNSDTKELRFLLFCGIMNARDQ